MKVKDNSNGQNNKTLYTSEKPQSDPENNYMFTENDGNNSIEDKIDDLILDKTGIEDKSGIYTDRDGNNVSNKEVQVAVFVESSQTINELVEDF